MATRPSERSGDLVEQSAPRAARSASSPGALTIVDLALQYGVGFDGLATYLRAKSAYAERTRAFRHHVIVPASVEHGFSGWHELPEAALSRRGRQRFSRLALRLVLDVLTSIIAPDVLLLHGPYAHAHRIVAHAQDLGASVIRVPWRGETAATPTRRLPWSRPQRKVGRSAPGDAASASPKGAHTLGPRLGVDSVFRPLPGARRGDHVLFAGELSRSSGVFELLGATAYTSEPWEVRLYGRGADERAITRRIASYGLSHRVRVNPYLADRGALAAEMAGAGCVVAPGPATRGQLVALEAAATGVPVVACEGSAITQLAPELAHPFPPGDDGALSAAIRAARAAPGNPHVGTRLADALAWETVLERELEELLRLAGHA
jgi:alpha-1,6-mannosyltransferase